VSSAAGAAIGTPAVDRIPRTVGPARDAAAADRSVASVESLHGFERAYRLTFVAALFALLLGALLPGWPGRWAGRTSHADEH
jgi:hypothetical protein